MQTTCMICDCKTYTVKFTDPCIQCQQQVCTDCYKQMIMHNRRQCPFCRHIMRYHPDIRIQPIPTNWWRQRCTDHH